MSLVARGRACLSVVRSATHAHTRALYAAAAPCATNKFAPAVHARYISVQRLTLASTDAAASSAPSEEPINPEEYAARQAAAGRFTEDDDEGGSFDGEPAYRPEDADPVRTALRNRLLDASLPLVHEHGWSHAALRAGAASLGMSTAAAGLATRGPVELVERAQQLAHEQMVERLSKLPTDSMSLNSVLEHAIRYRLEGIVAYQSRWPAALALLAHPCSVSTTVSQAFNSVDHIWHLCGDKSTETDWYTKRALLSGVYLSTELFLLSDRTAGNEATWAFLRRQLDSAKALAALPANLHDALGFAANIGATVWTRFVPTARR